MFLVPRPNFVLKPPDGSPLTRKAIQYELLNSIFTDIHKVFTPPPELEKGPAGAPRGEAMTFGELYTTSLACSSKGTKSMRDKIYADPVFARAMGMVSLQPSGRGGGRAARARSSSPFSSSLWPSRCHCWSTSDESTPPSHVSSADLTSSAAVAS